MQTQMMLVSGFVFSLLSVLPYAPVASCFMSTCILQLLDTMLQLYDLFQYTIPHAPLQSIPAVRPNQLFGPTSSTQYHLAE